MSVLDANKWNGIYARRDGVGEPSRWLVELTPRLARLSVGQRALDVAGGAGRHALYLAEHGWDVELVDVSSVGLEMAEAAAVRRGVRLRTRAVDLDSGLTGGPWDLVLIHHFCDRDLYRSLMHALRPAGLVAICHPTVENLERHTRPSRRWLVESGELREIFDTGAWDLLDYDEDWFACGRHEVRLLARRRP